MKRASLFSVTKMHEGFASKSVSGLNRFKTILGMNDLWIKSVKKIFTTALLLTAFYSGVYGQKNVSDFLEIGVADAKILTDAYLNPFGEMLGKTLNGGWYNSADVHKVAGFNFTIGVNMAMVPGSAKNFDVAKLLPQMAESWTLKDENVHLAPTVSGNMRTRPVLRLAGEDVLTLPNGGGFDKFPMPMVQFGVGLPFHTEISGRFVPGFEASDAGKVSLYGFSIKHSIKEYIPVLNRIPFLSTSLMFGYTSLDSKVSVAYQPRTNQSLNVSASGFTSRLLVGVNIPILAVYTGIGYGSTSSDFALRGDYMINGVNFYNPLSVGYKTSGFDANAGLRLRFGLFAIHGDYTFGDYPMATLGLGLSFR